MRYLLVLLLTTAAFAQPPAGQSGAANTAAQAQPGQAGQAAKPGDTTAPAPAEPKAVQEATKAEAQTAAPSPATEPALTGNLYFGYRFRSGPEGSISTYRSIVDLRDGPRLFGADFAYQDPKRRLFDRLTASAYNWGDPYNTASVTATKRGIYDFRFDYRNLLYYTALPSYANPLAPGGFTEQARDVHQRMASFDLELLPGKRIVPYLAYDRNSQDGDAVTTWVQDLANEYPLMTRIRDFTNNYRGGVRFEFTRFHLTLEQGGTTYKDDDSIFQTSTSTGNRTAPVFGQTLLLSSLTQAYGIRAHAIYSKALVTANPFSWLNLYGTFVYSQPKTDVNYQDLGTGNLAVINQLLFFSGQSDLATGSANKPHIAANLGFEARPFRRFRIVESWTTNRFHDATYSLLAQQLLGAISGLPGSPGTGTTQTINTTTALADREVVNYNTNQIDLFFDVFKNLTLRGGYKYEWGDATVRSGPLNPNGAAESGKLNRQVGIAGINYRAWQKLRLNAEYQGASTTHAYFRTSLYNYNRLRAQASYQVTASLSAQAVFTLLDNQNPIPGVSYDFRSRDNSFSLNWAPNGGKRVSILAEYDRATVRSNINYLIPPFLTPGVNSYRDNAHLATAVMDLTLPSYKGMAPKLTLGGSLAINNGSRPDRFYQPLGRLSVPLHKHVYWNTEWQWYGFNESLFLYEGFRTHLVQTGLRLSR